MTAKEKPSIASALNFASIDDLRDFTKDNQLYNIDLDDEETDETLPIDVTQSQIEKAMESMNQLKELRSQLKDIPDITSRKKSLDRLATMAESKFEDIFDRGFSCEDRFMAEIITAANNMLKIALDAHSKVIDSDIKLIDMQIKKDKMEIDINMKNKSNVTLGGTEPFKEESGTIRVSRNELLAKRKTNK